MRDGEPFVIGGLTQDNKLSTQGRIPLLSAAPGLSALARNESASSSKTDLYVIVTPHVVRGGEAAAAAALAPGD